MEIMKLMVGRHEISFSYRRISDEEAKIRDELKEGFKLIEAAYQLPTWVWMRWYAIRKT